MFFFEHESDESNEPFRLRHGMYSWDSGDYFPLVSGSSTNLVVNLIYTRMFFSNTNRTNLTNLLGATRYVFVGFGRFVVNLI